MISRPPSSGIFHALFVSASNSSGKVVGGLARNLARLHCTNSSRSMVFDSSLSKDSIILVAASRELSTHPRCCRPLCNSRTSIASDRSSSIPSNNAKNKALKTPSTSFAIDLSKCSATNCIQVSSGARPMLFRHSRIYPCKSFSRLRTAAYRLITASYQGLWLSVSCDDSDVLSFLPFLTRFRLNVNSTRPLLMGSSSSSFFLSFFSSSSSSSGSGGLKDHTHFWKEQPILVEASSYKRRAIICE
mmetsp:Transcript_23035/g.64631  ORF Transcript_23035/g.64631 Transcript_23035/m.64631 type:complete len:245 (-) Transcript_23035:335-1069(-)